MLKIITVPNQTLTSTVEKVVKFDNKLRQLIINMEKILVAQTDPPGVGLAANQVSVNLSLFIIKPSQKAKTKVFINPKIVKKIENIGKQFIATKNKGVINHATTKKSKSKKRIKLEGCLSIPRIWGPVKRADKILLEYQTADGDRKTNWFSGFEAMIIQHEMDHLNGILFTQRAVEQRGQLYREEKGELTKFELT
jgi:peptide deformylase